MQAADVAGWRTRMGYSQNRAAEVLGVARRTFIYWENGDTPVPRTAELAMAAIERGAVNDLLP